MAKINDIQPFIDLGWYTVPLKGELKRLGSGKKTIPIYENNWKAKYTKEKNTNASRIGGVLTGALSGIIAIDCDNEDTYLMFRALDPEYNFVFVSSGKKGGTIIYKMPEDNGLSKSFSLVTENIKLDFFSTSGFVYLPTEDNTSKESWEGVPELAPTPKAVITLLKLFNEHYSLSKGHAAKNYGSTTTYSFSLAPLLRSFVRKKIFLSALFRVITPKDFRHLSQYAECGFLHPHNVPDGRGSEYLSRVSAILGADKSVDEELYDKAIRLINSFWDKPMELDRLNKTIITPMLDNTASVDGVAIWQYNPKWENGEYYLETKKGEVVEIFFDDHTTLSYIVNQSTGVFNSYKRVTDCFSVAETISSIPLKKPAFVRNLPLIVANVKPELASGMYTIDTIDGPKKAFNLFRQSRALSILNNPDLYLQYKRPDNMLQFLESLIPDNDIREYVIRFIKTKLTTFGYSPVVLYFLGISGSGKDTFVELLNKILGEEYAYLAKPTADHFVEKHNGWMKDIFFAHLDEFGNQLSSLADKNEALGKIKTYTGSPYVQIREMRSDSTPRKHSVTFIMTANKNPLILDAEDRRFVIIKTPNILKEEEWVQANGGMSVTRDKMWGELNDFCYYLATEVKSLSSDEYTAPPNNPDKLGLIADMLNPVDYVVFCLMHGMVDRIKQIIEIAHYYPFTVLRTDSVYESRLRALVDAYDPEAYSIKYLNASLRKYNIKKIPTTLDGDRDNHCVFSVPVEFRKAVDFEVTQPIL